MDDSIPRWRRCKTPVRWIGQLESKTSESTLGSDPATCLADEYRAELPARTFTPRSEISLPPRRQIRKVKCQPSLRDVMKEQAKPARYSSDSETLCGSEASSPTTSTLSLTKDYPEVIEPPALPDDDIAMHICTSLLTNELSKSLFKLHPVETEDRASGLQILLMIEAYEAMQQQLRAQRERDDDSNTAAVDEILEQWLDVLYTIYDRSQSRFEDIQECTHQHELWQPGKLQIPCAVE